MKITTLISGLIFIFLSVACSSGSTPVAPSNAIDSDSLSDLVSSGSAPETPVNTRGVFGAWQIAIDTSTLTAEILPARNAQAIGNIFDADLTQFLEVSPCANCVEIGDIFFDGYNNLNVSMMMKHPFSNLLKRPDLHGFDVRGIFVMPSTVTDTNIDVIRPGNVTEDASWSLLLLNPDGYTSHFDELVTDNRYFFGGTDVTGNLNPFLRFFEDYSTGVFDPTIPHGYNVIPVGSMNYERTAVFGNFSGSTLQFYFVADVAYGQSAVLANRMNPQYYLPAFNRTEPWRVEYWIENNTLDRWDNTSTADVVVQVFDWQQGATVDANYPDPANLSGIPQQSNVLRVELSVPNLQNDPVVQPVAASGSGTPTDPLVYRLTVTNTNSYEYTPVTGLLAVRDELYGQPGRIAIPVSPAGFPYETLDILDYSVYLPVYINMVSANTTVSGFSDFGENELFVPYVDQFAPEVAASEYRTTIHPRFFMDPSGRKFDYDWDFEYDGVTFDPDDSGMPSPEITYTTPGLKNTALRVSTNSVPPREYLFEIPVSAEGAAFNIDIPSASALRNSTSATLRHSMYYTNDNMYLVYTNENGGQRDIRVAIYDRLGNVNTFPVTNDANVDYDPSILVYTTGTNAGIYVAYASFNGSRQYIYVTHLNMDGSGLNPANQIRISTGVDRFEFTPVLYKFGSNLCVYYFYFSGATGRIYGSHSDDWGATWNSDGWLVDNGSSGQMNPTAAYGGFNRNCLIWEDYINEADYGSDLYMAESTDGYTFSEIRNISIFRDKTHEKNPSADYVSGFAAITYLAYPDGETIQRARIKYIGLSPYDDSHFDYELDRGMGVNETHTTPTISATSSGHCFVTYGTWDSVTQEATEFLLDVYQPQLIGKLYNNVVLERSVGTVPSTSYGHFLYPAVYAKHVTGGAFEVFLAYKDYSAGSYLSPVVPNRAFGEIALDYFIVAEE